MKSIFLPAFLLFTSFIIAQNDFKHILKSNEIAVSVSLNNIEIEDWELVAVGTAKNGKLKKIVSMQKKLTYALSAIKKRLNNTDTPKPSIQAFPSFNTMYFDFGDEFVSYYQQRGLLKKYPFRIILLSDDYLMIEEVEARYFSFDNGKLFTKKEYEKELKNKKEALFGGAEIYIGSKPKMCRLLFKKTN